MKSKPISVRYEIDRFDFACRELGLETIQQVLDHFLGEFWDERHEIVTKTTETAQISRKTEKPYKEIVRKEEAKIEHIKAVAADTVGASKFTEILRKVKNGAKYEVGELREMGLNGNQVQMIMKWKSN